MEVKTTILRFTGDKAELHTQLKKWCEESEKSINGTVLELITKHIKKNVKN